MWYLRTEEVYFISYLHTGIGNMILSFYFWFHFLLYLVSVTRYSLSILVRNYKAGADVPVQSECILRTGCR